jgi:prophage regulatory protein
MRGAPQELERIIRRPELLRLTGLSAATIFRLIRRNEFPAPVELSKNARGWKASQVQAWFDGLRTPEAGPGGEAPETRRRRGPADVRREGES